jgi:superfamily II DNA or RNA helicase
MELTEFMPYSNASVDLLLGNVESRIMGPAPVERLDRELNTHVSRHTREIAGGGLANDVRIFNPLDGTFITGALPSVKRVLRFTGVRFRVRDLRSAGRRLHDWELGGCVLRDYQEEVVEAAVRRGTGLVDIGTGGGKTALAAAVIARIGRPTLYLVTTRTLLIQTRRELRRYLGIEPGVIGDGERNPEELTVALPQVLARPEEDVGPWQEGVVIFDEGHHAAAFTWFQLLRRVRARFNFFLTAAPFRERGDQAVLDALTGGSLTGGAYSARYLVDRGYACPVEVRLERCSIRGKMTERRFWDLYEEFIVRNDERNERIVSTTHGHLERGRSVLVLVDRKEHGRRLLGALGEGAAFVHGDRSRSFLRDHVDRFAAGELGCLIATAGLFQEGVSIEGIQVLIQAGALKSRVKVLQSIGRGMRRAPGKDRCIYHDFFDDDSLGTFRAHSLQRLRVMREEGFDVPRVPPREPRADLDEPIPPTWSHVAGTRRFVLLDGDGRLYARGVCLAKEPVPERFCGDCQDPPICADGGIVRWRDDSV